MPKPTPSQTIRALAQWPPGIALTSWNYMWRTTPMTRSEEPAPAEGHRPPPLPHGVSREGVQEAGDGVGDLYHRRYAVGIAGARLDAESLLRALRDDLNQVVPTEFARFLREGGDGPLETGDDWVVHMPGPWNGPVRVVETTPTSFRLATLAGHLEAGQIEFRAIDGDPLVFEIESWARSGDRLSKLLYQHARMAKEIQLHMWTSVLEKVVALAGGRRAGRLEITTRRVAA